jgi:hypothetical protein
MSNSVMSAAEPRGAALAAATSYVHLEQIPR